MKQETIEGRRPVLEALKSQQPMESVVLLHGTQGDIIGRIRQLARKEGIPVKEVDRRRFAEMGGTDSSQGVISVLEAKQYSEVDDLLRFAKEKGEPAFLLILDEIEDPQNLGALLRTAECAGVHGVILPKRHSATINQTVAKTSAGAWLHLRVAKVNNIVQTLDELKSSGIWIVGTDSGGDRLYTNIDYGDAVAIVIGNEGKGIRRLVKEKCDFLIRIPLYGHIDSLNASVAGGLVLFEVARKRHGMTNDTEGPPQP